jgi:hypothetical protein
MYVVEAFRYNIKGISLQLNCYALFLPYVHVKDYLILLSISFNFVKIFVIRIISGRLTHISLSVTQYVAKMLNEFSASEMLTRGSSFTQ